jgi:hypothetical protein
MHPILAISCEKRKAGKRRRLNKEEEERHATYLSEVEERIKGL